MQTKTQNNEAREKNLEVSQENPQVSEEEFLIKLLQDKLIIGKATDKTEQDDTIKNTTETSYKEDSLIPYEEEMGGLGKRKGAPMEQSSESWAAREKATREEAKKEEEEKKQR